MSSPLPPDYAETCDELAAGLQELRTWAGVSYRELHRRVVDDRRQRNVPELPAYDTVYRCLQPGRSRLDSTLVMDIVRVLEAPDPQAWRRACQVLMLDDTAAAVTVADLPPRPPHVSGRAPELSQLVMPTAAGRGRWLISGMSGVGKTTLAVEAAYRLAHPTRAARALFIDAAGSDRSRRATAEAILDGLLRRPGVHPAKIAGADLRRRIALFETALHRDVVLVVDDVGTPDQLKPLLVARGPFTLLSTSRTRLALPRSVTNLHLDVLAPRESVELLAVASADPALARSSEADLLADLAGHLPLALAGVVGRLRARPGWSLADHVEQLTELRRADRLDSAVDASLQLSYDALAPGERELLRRMALHPTSTVSRHAAAAMVSADPNAVEPGLQALLRANLVLSGGQDRYQLHLLIRTLARARALDEDSPSARQAALDRLYVYHQHVTAAARARWSRNSTGSAASSTSESGLPELASRTEALAWLTAERANLLVTAHQAIDQGRPDHAAAMSGLLFRFLEQENYAIDASRLHRAVADATTGRDRALALNCLGATHGTLGRWEDARLALAESLDLFAKADDGDGVGWVVGNLGAVCSRLADYPAALEYSQWSLRIAEEQLDLSGQAISLHNIALILDRLGRTAEGLHHHRGALAITRQLGDLVGESRGLSSLGAAVAHELGDEEARPILLDALRTAQAAESRFAECEALSQLAGLDSRAGRHPEALATYREALRLAVDHGRPETVVEISVAFGTSLLRAGKVSEAAPVLTSALEGARELQDANSEARASSELAIARASQEAGDRATPTRVHGRADGRSKADH